MNWTNRTSLTSLVALLAALALHGSATAEGSRGRNVSRKVDPEALQCPTANGLKIEQAPWAYSGDKVIASVCIKAGTQLFSFTSNGNDGCYIVTGLGTSNVTISGGGTSSSCKDISNVVFYPGGIVDPGIAK